MHDKYLGYFNLKLLRFSRYASDFRLEKLMVEGRRSGRETVSNVAMMIIVFLEESNVFYKYYYIGDNASAK